jgi:catechol 2,3-dioxygenase-like lactoylglutathione lyase family enzyme
MPGTLGDRMELMVLAAASAPSRQHIGLEVPDIQRTYKQLLANGLPNRFKPFPAQNPVNRWIMFIRDPNGVRIEFMGEAVDPKQGK